jgi:arylsulfatase
MQFVFAGWLSVAPALPASATTAVGSKPNVVLLFMDDAGYGDLGCYGHPTIRTPCIDRMAAEGTKFTQFYSASPACSASRYALLTGRLPVRSGFNWVLEPQSTNGLRPEEFTIAEGLKVAGYRTACFGKWHLGRPQKFLPLQQGFDEYFGLPYSNDMEPPKWDDLPLLEGDHEIETNPDQSKLTGRYTERTIQFIEENQIGPFFCYLAYSMPHVPLSPGERFRDKSLRGEYGDVIEELDWSVGKILETLRKKRLSDRTLVILTSDNGPWIIKGAHGGSAGPLRDGKGSTWEGGMREPFIAWWPGTVPAGHVCTNVATTMDILPTVFRLAGTSISNDRKIDGIDICDDLLGQDRVETHPPLFYYGNGGFLYAVRDGAWKLHVRQFSQTGVEYFDGKVPLLFNLESDPSEQYDLAGDNPEIVRDLQTLIDEQERSLRTHHERSGTN